MELALKHGLVALEALIWAGVGNQDAEGEVAELLTLGVLPLYCIRAHPLLVLPE